MKANIRLVLRHEGDFWNAYIALPGTMVGAALIGSIAIGAVRDLERRASFQNLMASIVKDCVRDALGVEAIMGDAVTAPEHERAGHG